MARHQEIITELQRLGRVATSLQTRYSAHFSLHQVAAMAGDRQEIAQRRDELHTILDVILDNGESIHRLTEELHRLSAGDE